MSTEKITIICPYCNSAFDSDTSRTEVFCPNCGSKQKILKNFYEQSTPIKNIEKTTIKNKRSNNPKLVLIMAILFFALIVVMAFPSPGSTDTRSSISSTSSITSSKYTLDLEQNYRGYSYKVSSDWFKEEVTKDDFKRYRYYVTNNEDIVFVVSYGDNVNFEYDAVWFAYCTEIELLGDDEGYRYSNLKKEKTLIAEHMAYLLQDDNVTKNNKDYVYQGILIPEGNGYIWLDLYLSKELSSDYPSLFYDIISTISPLSNISSSDSQSSTTPSEQTSSSEPQNDSSTSLNEASTTATLQSTETDTSTNSSTNNSFSSEYDLAYAQIFKEYSVYYMIDIDNKKVINFVTNDTSILEGTYTGDINSKIEVYYSSYDYTETLEFTKGGMILIDDLGYEIEYIEVTVYEAESNKPK